MPSLVTDFTVCCAACGSSLDATEKYHDVRVGPCKKCMESERQDGYNEGFSEGHSEGYDAGVATDA